MTSRGRRFPSICSCASSNPTSPTHGACAMRLTASSFARRIGSSGQGAAFRRRDWLALTQRTFLKVEFFKGGWTRRLWGETAEGGTSETGNQSEIRIPRRTQKGEL